MLRKLIELRSLPIVDPRLINSSYFGNWRLRRLVLNIIDFVVDLRRGRIRDDRALIDLI